MKEKIEAYLQSKNPTAQVLKATVLAGGASGLTVLVDLKWVEKNKEEQLGMVFKIHQAAGTLSDASDQMAEFEILKALMDTDIKTPKVYWAENDKKWLGDQFYVMERLPGTTSSTAFRKDPELRKTLARQLVENMAKIHLVDIKKLAFLGIPTSSVDCAQREIAKWEELYRAHSVFPDPAFEEVVLWLKANKPTDVARISLLWGDPGPGNFMYEGNRLTGCIDWEMAHIGDPMDEIGMFLGKCETTETLMTTEEFYQYYEEYSGIKINQKSIDYYRALWNFRLAVITTIALNEFVSGNTSSVFSGYSGALFGTLEMRKAFSKIQILEEGKFYATV